MAAGVPYEVGKRAFDVAASVAAMVALAPVMGCVAVAVRAKLGKGVLFRQVRPGRGAKPFTMVKFRTMKPPEPGKDGGEHDGARLTKFGDFLRSTSLDELPSLWNVLKGEMSVVGPRPLLVDYLPHYSLEQARRHEVKGGLTSWAVIHGRNALTWERKFELDVWYVDNRSFLLDLQIIFRTVRLVLTREGVNTPGYATFPRFTGSASGTGDSVAAVESTSSPR